MHNNPLRRTPLPPTNHLQLRSSGEFATISGLLAKAAMAVLCVATVASSGCAAQSSPPPSASDGASKAVGAAGDKAGDRARPRAGKGADGSKRSTPSASGDGGDKPMKPLTNWAEGQLFFNETFDPSSTVSAAWRYECMTDHPHTYKDLLEIDTTVDAVLAVAESEGPLACGLSDGLTKIERERQCCSPLSGMGSDPAEPAASGAAEPAASGGTEAQEAYCHGHYRLGTCKPKEKTQEFESWPLDVRRYPKVHDVSGTKGGGEMAIRSTKSPLFITYNNSGGVQHQGWDPKGTSYLKDGKTVFFGFRFKVRDISMLTNKIAKSFYVFQQHSIHQNVDNPGVRRAPENNEKKTGRTESSDEIACWDMPQVHKQLLKNGMAPTVAMLIGPRHNHDGEFELRFYTKNPNIAYYRSEPAGPQKNGSTNASPYSLVPCDDGSAKVCGEVLWRTPFSASPGSKNGIGVGEWIDVVIEMRVAKLKKTLPSCDAVAVAELGEGYTLARALCEYCSEDATVATVDSDGNPVELNLGEALASIYEQCQPSDGYLSLWVNGIKRKGNVARFDACDSPTAGSACGTSEKRTMMWAYGKTKFTGVTTKFGSCPSYIKLGHYAHGYDYAEINDKIANWKSGFTDGVPNSFPEYPVPRLVTEFDHVRIASTWAVAAGASPLGISGGGSGTKESKPPSGK